MPEKPSAFATLVRQAKARIQAIDAADLAGVLQREPKAVVIDTREREEYDAGHVAGAIWLGKGIIERDIESTVPEHDRPIFLYCGGGSRSALAADNVQKMGYTRVFNVEGGWRALKQLVPTE